MALFYIVARGLLVVICMGIINKLTLMIAFALLSCVEPLFSINEISFTVQSQQQVAKDATEWIGKSLRRRELKQYAMCFVQRLAYILFKNSSTYKYKRLWAYSKHHAY